MKRISFSEQEINDMINLYKNQNYSLNKISEKYNVSRSVISRVFKENNIETRKITHKIKCDYDIFETIDSNEKAYWLGFIAADGCNYKRKQNATILINISAKDKDHLQKFVDFCKLDKNITEYTTSAGFSNNTKMCKIEIYSNKMSQDLSNKGIVPRKSLILKPPNINSEYYLPFILGYFDGDGSIFKTSQGAFGINIEGTREILEWINSILNISENNTLSKRKDDGTNNYYIRCGGTNKPYKIMK